MQTATSSKHTSIIKTVRAYCYFSDDTRLYAFMLRNSLASYFEGVVKVSSLREYAVSLHPLPMFEVIFPIGLLPQVKRWFENHRGTHSVMLCPELNDMGKAYQQYATWLGTPLHLAT